MQTSTSGTQQDVQRAVFLYLRSLIPADIPVIFAQENDVEIPKPPFVMINPGLSHRIATNSRMRSVDGHVTVEQATQSTVQVDCYGQGGADRMAIITALWRDSYACDWFRHNVPALTPLYAQQRQHVQFINEAQDYEERWTVDLILQANQRVTYAEDTAIYPGPISTKDLL